ncbi:TetR/AcrR family transcriptional regulator C-terminal domain-containing protein [Microbacterium aerolatum]|uniref:TetR/AcrR family transcriptional regulator C-terminal domain-containing protein n=1 Tax=Microbacterium aerolatum TaxID=153731 RepID=UPI00166B30A5|nr:TetR/AcrR family transcriptional regulator C-terminal domain-containing protein [Microbacterium aerolatum]
MRAIGVHAGLTLDRIIAAARSMTPDELSMQALARRLGVDRKAINHHVSDRDTLLGMVAMDAFATSFSAVEIAHQADWEEACRTYAFGFTDSAIATGVLADRIRLTDPYVTQILEPTEAVLQKMVEAGFDDESAMRTLSLLTNICLAYARDVVIELRSGVTPRTEILRGALEQRDAAKFPTLARIAELTVTTYDRRQLEMSVELFIAGARDALHLQTVRAQA